MQAGDFPPQETECQLAPQVMHDHRVAQINVLVYEATDQHFHEASAFFPGHPACRKYQRCEDTTVDLVDPFTILPLLFTFIGGELTPDFRTRSQAVLWVCNPNIKKGILLPGPEATCSNVDTSLQRSICRSSRQVFVTVGEQCRLNLYVTDNISQHITTTTTT